MEFAWHNWFAGWWVVLFFPAMVFIPIWPAVEVFCGEFSFLPRGSAVDVAAKQWFQSDGNFCYWAGFMAAGGMVAVFWKECALVLMDRCFYDCHQQSDWLASIAVRPYFADYPIRFGVFNLGAALEGKWGKAGSSGDGLDICCRMGVSLVGAGWVIDVCSGTWDVFLHPCGSADPAVV